jgi:uncharacterized membrane protein
MAPRAVARMAGISTAGPFSRQEPTAILRLSGLREIATGLGIVSRRRPAGWLWARVAGDLLDLTFLGNALRGGKADPVRLATATAAVAGITAIDVACGRQLGGSRRAVSSERRRDGSIRLTSTIAINQPPSATYEFWRRLENLPRFIRHLETVQEREEGKSHWRLRVPGGAAIEWDAEITQDRPNELITWRSIGGGPVSSEGAVRFLMGPKGDGTLLRVSMRYRARRGALGVPRLVTLFGKPGAGVLKQDLRRLKQILETGAVLTTEGQSHGPAPLSLTRALGRS